MLLPIGLSGSGICHCAIGWLLAVTFANSQGATFTVTTTNAAGAGSLSNAIAQANLSSLSATNFIQFAIPPLDSNTVQTITLPSSSSGLSPLPPISRRVIIDGYTQPGASNNTNAIGDNAKILIRIDGSVYNGVFFGPILQLNSGSDGSIVRGLAIIEAGNNAVILNIASQSNSISGNFIGVDTDGVTVSSAGTPIQVAQSASNNTLGGTFPGARNVVSSSDGPFGLLLSDGNNLLVQGNYFGVNASGTAILGSCQTGINVEQGTGVTIGGSAPGAGNLVNAVAYGVQVSRACCTLAATTVQGNLIGTDATGTTALNAVSAAGINLGASVNTMIGGSSPGAGNVISARGYGILISGNTTGIVIQGNKIGTDITGTKPLGNGACGISGPPGFDSATIATIGGTNAGEGNIIAFSSLNGVSVATSGGNSWAILGNSIHDNVGLGITLGGCGAGTPITNDGCGTLNLNSGNHHQMFPVITGVSMSGGNVTLSGSFNSTPNKTYRLEFFANPSCDPRGFGQGTVYLGFTNVMTDASCSAVFALTLPNPSGFANFTATATDTNGNTSEFSACANASGPVLISRFSNLSVSGTNLIISGTGGSSNANYHVVASTNVALPLSNWISLLTNHFDGSGNFTFTNTISPDFPTRFYRLSVP